MNSNKIQNYIISSYLFISRVFLIPHSKTNMNTEHTSENIFTYMWNFILYFNRVNVVNLGTFQRKFLEREFPRKKTHHQKEPSRESWLERLGVGLFIMLSIELEEKQEGAEKIKRFARIFYSVSRNFLSCVLFYLILINFISS